MTGTLALIGSGAFTSAMRSVDTLLLVQAAGRRVLVVATAADGPATVAAMAESAHPHLAELGAEVVLSHVRSRSDALGEQPPLHDVDLIYLVGANIAHAAEVLAGTPYADSLISGWRGGVPLAAASAGAVILGTRVYDRDDVQTPARQGVGLVRAAVIPNWQQVSRTDSGFVARVIAEQPHVLALDEQTAAVHSDSGWMVTGRGAVLIGSAPPLRPLAKTDLPPQRWPALI
jgi:cyanophycinase-like exopeptidase